MNVLIALYKKSIVCVKFVFFYLVIKTLVKRDRFVKKREKKII